jgi:hypothetical protein
MTHQRGIATCDGLSDASTLRNAASGVQPGDLSLQALTHLFRDQFAGGVAVKPLRQLSGGKAKAD